MSVKAAPHAILCAGRVYCDLVFTGAPDMPVMGTETFAKDLSLHAGGGALITGAAFSALGWRVSLLSTLPAAPFDTLVREDIAALDLDASLSIAATSGAAPQISVAIAGRDDRAFLTNTSGAAMPDIVFPKAKFRHLHVGELRSLVEHPSLIDKAKAAGMTISVDCGWDDALLSQGARLAPLLSKIDVFLPNKIEFDRLSKSGLLQGTCALTVVKCGSDGAKALIHDDWITQATTPSNVIDATGAGDAFNGGFLSEWLTGSSLQRCMENGNLCGRASVQHAGGTGGLLTMKRNAASAKSKAAE